MGEGCSNCIRRQRLIERAAHVSRVFTYFRRGFLASNIWSADRARHTHATGRQLDRRNTYQPFCLA